MRIFRQMKLIGIDKLIDFWKAKRDAENALHVWIQSIEQMTWKNPAETRLTYRHADLVGDCTVFNELSVDCAYQLRKPNCRGFAHSNAHGI